MKNAKPEVAEFVQSANEPLKIFNTPEGAKIDYFFPREISSDPSEFIDFLRALNDAKDDDEVDIHLNCCGGDLTTTKQIIDTIINCPARVKISVEGDCASAATMIALTADELEVSPHSSFMIHCWSSLVGGKWQELKSLYEFDKIQTTAFFKEIYKGFLTDEEIERCLNGEDFYFSADEITKRVAASRKRDYEKQELIQKIADKYQTAINKEIEKELAKFDAETKKQENAKK